MFKIKTNWILNEKKLYVWFRYVLVEQNLIIIKWVNLLKKI